MANVTAQSEGLTAVTHGDIAFRTLAETLEDCVFLTDHDGRYLAVNRHFTRWVGRPEAEILGRTAFHLWPGSFAESDAVNDRLALAGERIEREEQRPCGGHIRTVRTVRTPVRDDGGFVRGVLGVFRDVTGEEAPDETRRRAARMELVGRLAGGVAHDFNNLLSAVIGHMDLLRGYVAPESPHLELLAAAEKAAIQAAALAQYLLAFLRKEPCDPEPVDLNAVVEQVIALLRRTFDPRIHLHVSLQPSLPQLEAVPVQLAQVLLNLCLNARDAMPAGGRLRIETIATVINVEAARQHPQRRTGEFARLRVADSGEGMTPAVQARLFEPAFTTKAPGQGSGMGLAIVQTVMQQHDGWVECVSAAGQETCFDVYLPIDRGLHETKADL
jgi:two-component system, cell cycle sensor histidine kinase and response regulator CckA